MSNKVFPEIAKSISELGFFYSGTEYVMDNYTLPETSTEAGLLPPLKLKLTRQPEGKTSVLLSPPSYSPAFSLDMARAKYGHPINNIFYQKSVIPTKVPNIVKQRLEDWGYLQR